MPKSAAALFFGKNKTCQRFAAAFNALKVWDLVFALINCGRNSLGKTPQAKEATDSDPGETRCRCPRMLGGIDRFSWDFP